MGKKGRVLPFARPTSRDKADRAPGPAAVGPVPANSVSADSLSASAGSAVPAPGGGATPPPPASPLPRRIPGANHPMPGGGTPRRNPASGVPLSPAPGSWTLRLDPPGSTAAGPPPRSVHTAAPDARPEPDSGRAAGPDPGPEPDTTLAGAVVPGPPSEVERRAAAPVAPRAEPGPEPSWGKVLATTVRLWLSRRPLSQRLVVALVALLVVFAAGGLTVGLIRHSGNGRPAPARSGSRDSTGSPSLIQAAAAARNSAAVWVSTQVSHSTVVSCDPAMCAALEVAGFPAGDLMTLGPASTDPLGSQVVVSTAAIRSLFGSRLTAVYAPTVLASFGSGSAQVDVRVYATGGAAAYLAALRSDHASRERVGRLLAGNSRVSAPPAARQQLRAGQVDSRLLVTIATLSHQGPVRIVAFGDSGPGAAVGIPLREVEIASPPGARIGYLRSELALLRAQQQPYLASTAKLTFLVTGREVVQIVFDAPSPLGLLSG